MLLLLMCILLFIVAWLVITKSKFPRMSISHFQPPGLTIEPMAKTDMSLVWINKDYGQRSVEKIDSLLKQYEENCTKGRCGFAAESLGPCSRAPYGYVGSKKPICIYIMINKFFSWSPEGHTNTAALPKDMPNMLKNFILGRTVKQPENKLNYAWMSCEGERSVDRDQMGYFQYYPQPAFDSRLFPSESDPFSTPLVALAFYDITPGILIFVRCRVYAKNVPDAYSAVVQIYVEPDS